MDQPPPSAVLKEQIKRLKDKNYQMARDLERKNGELMDLQKALTGRFLFVCHTTRGG